MHRLSFLEWLKLTKTLDDLLDDSHIWYEIKYALGSEWSASRLEETQCEKCGYLVRDNSECPHCSSQNSGEAKRG